MRSKTFDKVVHINQAIMRFEAAGADYLAEIMRKELIILVEAYREELKKKEEENEPGIK